jgi:hypothetical protein
MVWILRGEARFHQSVLIQRQGYHDNYVCSFGGVALLCGDGMDSSTQIPAVRHLWVAAALSYHARH